MNNTTPITEDQYQALIADGWLTEESSQQAIHEAWFYWFADRDDD